MKIVKKNELKKLNIWQIFNWLTEMIISKKIDYEEVKSLIKDKSIKKKLNYFKIFVLNAYSEDMKKRSKINAIVWERLVEIAAAEVFKKNENENDIPKKIKEDINKELDVCKKYFQLKKYDLYYETISSLLRETCWLGSSMYMPYSMIFIIDLSELYYRKEKGFFDKYMDRILKDFEFDESVSLFLKIISSLENDDVNKAKELKEKLPPLINTIAEKMIEFKLKS